ncbi:MAG: hypothetical protein SVW02_04295 [Candidatus Nanohaloarchaea archaeon]|nr:hypothetical protein [Candidatus Nanohaloarchaea archaeon]
MDETATERELMSELHRELDRTAERLTARYPSYLVERAFREYGREVDGRG